MLVVDDMDKILQWAMCNFILRYWYILWHSKVPVMCIEKLFMVKITRQECLFLAEPVYQTPDTQCIRPATNGYFHHHINLPIISLLTVWSTKCQKTVYNSHRTFPKSKCWGVFFRSTNSPKPEDAYFYYHIRKAGNLHHWEAGITIISIFAWKMT